MTPLPWATFDTCVILSQDPCVGGPQSITSTSSLGLYVFAANPESREIPA